ncbi:MULTISPECIES: LacI family DNA-binding transcriptional regulator [Chitinophagaceae]
MKKQITLQDIADSLQTTRATVSRALSNHSSISDDTKAKVAAQAQKMGYRNNRLAASLRSGKSFVIGVLIPSAEISFFGSIVHGIEKVAREHGYSLLLIQTEESQEKERKGIDTLLALKVDGILASLTKETKNIDHFQYALSQETPIVLFDRVGNNSHIPCVVNNDFQGAMEATAHLIEKGYRKIFHIGGPQHLPIFQKRFQGYKAALAEANIKFQKSWFVEGNVSIASGENAVKEWLDNGLVPDAIFAVEDYTALGALNALKAAQLKIPEQVGVIGFANELFGKYITPSLSTMDQQTELMGRQAMELLLEILQEKISAQAFEQKNIAVKPIYRESTKQE